MQTPITQKKAVANIPLSDQYRFRTKKIIKDR